MILSRLSTKAVLSALFLTMALGCGQNGNNADCGNGTLDQAEQCDDGNTQDGDGCSSVCEVEDECGDAVLSAGEQCDDGNTISGDGCSSLCVDENTSAVQINAYIESLGRLPVDPPSATETPASPEQPVGPYLCTNKTVTEVKVFDTYPSQGAVVNKIFPGMLMQGASLFDGSFEEVPLPKKPLTVSMNVGTQNPATIMQTPSRSGFLTAQDQLFQQAVLPTDSFAPKFHNNFDKDTVNEDQLSLELGFTVNAGIATNVDVAGQFNFQNNNKRTRRLIRLVDEMYTVTVDKPAKASDFFADSVATSDVQNFFTPGNPAVYVDSITYGREIYIAIESNFTSTEIEAALQAAVNSAQADATLDFGLTVKQVLDELTIQGIAVGGITDATGSDAVDLNNLKDPAALQRIFNRQANTTFNQRGVPISFTVSYLADATSAKTSVSGTYPVEDCVRAPVTFAVDVNQLNVTGASDGGIGAAQNNVEIRGTIAVSFGGNRVFLFNQGAGNEVSFVVGPVSPSSSFLHAGDLPGVDTIAGNQVDVEFNLVEEDGINDDVFTQTFSIPVENLFDGEEKISFNGAGFAGDLFIGFTPSISPVP